VVTTPPKRLLVRAERREAPVDDHRFDAMIRSLGAIPRRTAISGLVGVGLGFASGWLGSEGAARNRRRRRKRCKANTKRCRRKCIPRANCCNDGDCSEVTVCRNGACVCPLAGQAVCEGICIDVAGDAANCGDCSFACASGECVNGACTCESAIECAGLCACGARLESGNVCFAGGNNGIPCTGDDDCPFRSLCFDNGFCSVPCLG
jgi:hypothetical protein